MRRDAAPLAPAMVSETITMETPADAPSLRRCCQGDYVALASEADVIVGVDVAAPQQLRRGKAAKARPLVEALAVLRQQLTDCEVGARL